MKKIIEKKTTEIRKNIDFPYGSRADIDKYLSEQEDSFALELPSYDYVKNGDYVLKNVTFDHRWSGYEDHDFFIVAELEESDLAFQKRLNDEIDRKNKEDERRIKKQKEDELKKERARIEEIKKLKDKLAELERTK